MVIDYFYECVRGLHLWNDRDVCRTCGIRKGA